MGYPSEEAIKQAGRCRHGEPPRAVLNAVYPIIRRDVAREIAERLRRDAVDCHGVLDSADWIESTFAETRCEYCGGTKHEPGEVERPHPSGYEEYGTVYRRCRNRFHGSVSGAGTE